MFAHSNIYEVGYQNNCSHVLYHKEAFFLDEKEVLLLAAASL